MKGACVWCNTIVRLPAGFDSKKNDVVCSSNCLANERAFQQFHSDEAIGRRNLADHGINPNQLGKKGGNPFPNIR